jgi:hypothetical protein
VSVAVYRKAWVSGCVSALTGVSAAAGLLFYDWWPDGHVVAATARWAGGSLVLGLINGLLSAYGVAVVPNGSPVGLDVTLPPGGPPTGTGSTR